MLTLSQATSESRAILKWGAVILSVLFLIMVLVRVGFILRDKYFPKAPPPPTISFGKITPVTFPDNVSDKSFNYSLDTISGELPQFPDRINVHKISKPLPDLLALQKAKSKISGAGFTSQEIAVSPEVYQWNQPANSDSNISLDRSLKMDILSSNFTLSSNFISDPVVSSSANLNDTNTAIGSAQNFLTLMSSFPGDIDLAKTKTFLFSIKDNTLTSAPSVSGSQVIEVDFFQKDVDNLSIYYPKAVNSTISVLVVGGRNQPQIAQVNYSHQNISDESSTYPIKTAKQAFDELKQGKGYIASYFGTSEDISIKNVFPGYYLGDKKQDYLIPVAVFQGDNGFFAYVPLLTDEWTSK